MTASPYISHVTLTTGHTRQSPREEVEDDVLAVLVPWLNELVIGGAKRPLPVPPLSHFAANATMHNGAMVCTLWAPAGPHQPGKPARAELPMVTFAVAQSSQQGDDLWRLLLSQFGGPAKLEKPAEPWCAVVLHPIIAAYRGDVEWMGDFERCVAWAWITRNPKMTSVGR